MRASAFMLVLGLLVSAQPSSGCLWDRDTLADEAAGRSDVLATILGNFERKPRRYYEMRVERLQTELQKSDAPAALYDDLAVALDQTGRATEAIEWMERKVAAIARLADPIERKEQEYRRLANIGTFYAHRWIRSAERDPKTADLVVGISFIREALELNPNAHFGREKYQLQALEWYLRGTEKPLEIKHEPTYRTANVEHSFIVPHRHSFLVEGSEAALVGICGIIQLGNAWENVDLMQALEAACANAHHHSLAFLARMRLEELRAGGGLSAHPHVRFVQRPENRDLSHQGLPPTAAGLDRNTLPKFFAAARAVADANATARRSFTETRFRAGQHPDTHPNFWQHAPAAIPLPALPADRDHHSKSNVEYYTDRNVLVLWFAANVLVLGGYTLFVKRRRARAARTASSQPSAA